jgi:hypothetical protein
MTAHLAAVVLALILPTVPGKLNPQVKPATIRSTICVKGWTATIRPSSTYTRQVKLKQLVALGYTDKNPADYEEDHFVSLELGGAPDSELNLWPQPWAQARPDDTHENRYHQLVCNGTWGLNYARRVEMRWKRAHG